MPKPTLGVIFHPAFPPETLTDYARRSESAGFDELWLWDDCFLPGALTSAAIALMATQRLKVGIGLLPATAYNPLFMAMEITTLVRAFPDRFLPGLGHGVGRWMKQIGAAPKSSMKTLEETVIALRALLGGQKLTTHTEQLHLDRVKMDIIPAQVPPLYVGAMREKTLRLAGRVGDGTILTALSAPAYVRWAREQVAVGMAEAGRTYNRLVVYIDVKVSRDGHDAREAVRQTLASRLSWADAQLRMAGLWEEAQALVQKQGVEGAATDMPEAWIDILAAAGTPEQAAAAVQRLAVAGADSIVFQPLDGDPACLDEYSRLLMPLLRDSNILGDV